MSTSTAENFNRVKELLSDMKKMEFEPASESFIYRVPENIREINRKAYTPQLVSIGPFHHGKQELAKMENAKKRYVRSFFSRVPEEVESRIVTYVQTKEEDIRRWYSEPPELESEKFVMMVICDSIFIIELVCKSCLPELRYEEDLLIVVPALNSALSLDLLLLENQLPYFVIEEISKLSSFGEQDMIQLSNFFFRGFMFSKYSADNPVAIGKHFTDLLRNSLVRNYQVNQSVYGIVPDLPCAVKLHESGLKFRSVDEGVGVLHIRVEEKKALIPWLGRTELQIPHFHVFDETECLLRNVMALEQCLYYRQSDTRACDYVFLMDRLINTEKDVDFLVGKGIISDHLGDHASVAKMFNSLGPQIFPRNSSYVDTCKKLGAHYKNPWNQAKGTLKGVYFSNPWRGTATVAAVVLLLLTIGQTICSILQVI